MSCIDKKSIIAIMLSGMFAMLSYADKDVDYIAKMFSRENIRSTKLLSADKKGIAIIEYAWHDYYGDKRMEIERILLRGIRDFDIPVDVDGCPCKYEPSLIEDRYFFFASFMSNSRALKLERNELVDLPRIWRRKVES